MLQSSLADLDHFPVYAGKLPKFDLLCILLLGMASTAYLFYCISLYRTANFLYIAVN